MDPERCRRLTLSRYMGLRDVGVHHGVTTAKVGSPAIIETCFSYDKAIWIGATDYYMSFSITVLLPLPAILQLINFTAS